MPSDNDGRPTAAFTEALRIARAAAVDGGDPAIGVCHLMLGILRATEGSGHRALAHTGVDLGLIESRIAPHTATKASEVDPSWDGAHGATHEQGNVPLTVQAESIVAEAQKEVVRMESPAMDTGHLLLAILREPKNAATRALADLGIGYDGIDHDLGHPLP